MGDKTGIEWTDATWNPIRGCSRDHWRAMFDDTCGELQRLRGLAKLAAAELTMMADELKNSCTIGGEWDGSEAAAKEEYDRIMELAENLAS